MLSNCAENKIKKISVLYVLIKYKVIKTKKNILTD